MKLAGYISGDPEAARVARLREVDKIHLDHVPVWCVFTPDVVELDFVGDRHVPTMRVAGEIERVVPQTDLPFDIREITFEPLMRPRLVSDYAFSSEQIKMLVDKGLYLEGFTPPREMMSSVPWELTVDAAVTVVAPDHPDSPPLVMLDLREIDYLQIDQKSSGYELADLFPDYRGQMLQEGRLLDEQSQVLVPTVEAGQADLFADVAYGEDVLKALESVQRARGLGQPVSDREQARAQEAIDQIRAMSGLDLRADEMIDALAPETEEYEELARAAREAESELMTPWQKMVSDFYEENIRDAGVQRHSTRTLQEKLQEVTVGEDVGTTDADPENPEYAEHEAEHEAGQTEQTGQTAPEHPGSGFDGLEDIEGLEDKDLDDLMIEVDDTDPTARQTEQAVQTGQAGSPTREKAPRRDLFDEIDVEDEGLSDWRSRERDAEMLRRVPVSDAEEEYDSGSPSGRSRQQSLRRVMEHRSRVDSLEIGATAGGTGSSTDGPEKSEMSGPDI